ncbi:homing endonuclease [Salmonella phage bobsandoy]|uniref:Homing endonuclease n=1 Tax=Salmonella phage bobsandoy TaxID=2713284 RepID=A0A6G8RJ25_9CAUD|nr:homing endonuclease [Salmonella phage bobsandoy]
MITQQRLKELLIYDPDSGHFINRVSRGRGGKIGAIAGSPDKDGYIIIGIDRKSYKAHRLAFLYMEGYMPTEVDHDNIIPYDNKWSNLKDSSHSENMKNRNPYSKSGYRGVTWNKVKKKWQVQVCRSDGSTVYGGLFPYEELELAINKANELRAQHLGMDSRQELFKGYICRREDLDK